MSVCCYERAKNDHSGYSWTATQTGSITRASGRAIKVPFFCLVVSHASRSTKMGGKFWSGVQPHVFGPYKKISSAVRIGSCVMDFRVKLEIDSIWATRGVPRIHMLRVNQTSRKVLLQNLKCRFLAFFSISFTLCRTFVPVLVNICNMYTEKSDSDGTLQVRINTLWKYSVSWFSFGLPNYVLLVGPCHSSLWCWKLCRSRKTFRASARQKSVQSIRIEPSWRMPSQPPYVRRSAFFTKPSPPNLSWISARLLQQGTNVMCDEWFRVSTQETETVSLVQISWDASRTVDKIHLGAAPPIS